MSMDLFSPEYVVGVFRGFSESGMEFHADLVMPYRDEFQSTPMHGQFVLVQLEHNREAVFGRITTIAAQGRLVSPIGEDYAVRAVRDQREIPEELRDQYLKYKVNIRVLGVLRQEGDKLIFVPSHRRLPHVGSPVAFLAPDVLAEVANGNDPNPDAAEIGFLAFGEFVYCAGDPRADIEPWVVSKSPAIIPKFPIDKMISRRSFVFARAGFGKSNLVKLLFSALYGTGSGPAVPRRDGGRAPVGTVVFDPDGEYFWPDPRGNPGLCDVQALHDRLVVFTNRQAPSGTYGSFVVGGIRLDLRQLSAARVLGIALSAERQDQQNVAKLKGLSAGRWRDLVDLVAGTTSGDLYADPSRFKAIVGFGQGQDAEVNAAISNMSRVVRDLHDPSSQLLRALVRSLTDGKLCVVDISQMRGSQGLKLAGIILSHIFEHNQEQFTASRPQTIPTIAVIEEAQSVLGTTEQEDGPFVSWVKEGRKYDLGALMITQQPGSIPPELLSQGDNFFVFHMLSQGDLVSLKRANAHFSDDLLASLLNEPLVGHGVFWSSAPGTDRHARPYPLSIRALNFSRAHELLDGEYCGPPMDVYAARLRREYDEALTTALESVGEEAPLNDAGKVDAEKVYRQSAIRALSADANFWRRLETADGLKWGTVQSMLARHGPTVIDDKFDWAYGVVVEAMDHITHERGRRWTSTRRDDGKVWFTLVPETGGVPREEAGAETDEPPF